MPVIGAADIHLRLTTYSAAISAVIEQAVAGIDAGIGFAQIAAAASLPDELMHYDWLGEYYGKFSATIRKVYSKQFTMLKSNTPELGVSGIDYSQLSSSLIALAADTTSPSSHQSTAIKVGRFPCCCQHSFER